MSAAIRIHPEHVTGSAFVRYKPDGDRDFVFNIKHSACGHIAVTEAARALLAECGHFHIMGSSLFSFRIIDEIKKAIEIVKDQGGTVSFDPNVRKEMLAIPEMRAALEFMLQLLRYLPAQRAGADAADRGGHGERRRSARSWAWACPRSW